MTGSRAGRPTTAHRQARLDDAALWTSTPQVRARVQRQKTRDTALEVALRRLLHAARLRFCVDAAPLPGVCRRAEVVFGPCRVAVFVDGCFWHGCPDHGSRGTVADSEYWSVKIQGNRRRDQQPDQRLAAAGWVPLRIWERGAGALAARRVSAAAREGRPALRRHDATRCTA